MTRDHHPPSANGLEELVSCLPRDIEPPPELWPRIAALLDAAPPRSLEERARELPTEIAPPADLWPQIAARLRTAPRRPHARVAAAVAAVAAVAALVALAVRDHPADIAVEETVRVAPEGARTDVTPGTEFGAYWMLRSPVVSHEVAATLQRELTLVRDERLRIEAAIDREPENSGLRELWAHAYQVELQLADAYGRTIMAYSRG